MARILVTGGCGFVGSHIVDALAARGDSVHVLDNLSSGTKEYLPQNVTLTVGDVANPNDVATAMHGCDGVVHLAAIASVQQCRDRWADSHRTNVLGAVTVFDAAAKSVPSLPVVYASSAAVYGDNPALPLKETETPAPLTSYGLDKWTNEHYAAMAHRTYGLSSVGLRFFNIYGPRQNPSSPYSGVISLFSHAAKNNTPITLFGDGLQTRDFIHVSDIVRLVLSALDYATNNTDALVLNGCSGTQSSLLNLIGALNNIHNTTLEVQHKPAREGDIRLSAGSPDEAQRLLGFQSKTSLKDGLPSIQ